MRKDITREVIQAKYDDLIKRKIHEHPNTAILAHVLSCSVTTIRARWSPPKSPALPFDDAWKKWQSPHLTITAVADALGINQARLRQAFRVHIRQRWLDDLILQAKWPFPRTFLEYKIAVMYYDHKMITIPEVYEALRSLWAGRDPITHSKIQAYMKYAREWQKLTPEQKKERII